MAKTATTTPAQVIWYIPNCIGYLRVVFALCSFVLLLVWPDDYRILGIILYLANFVGDLFDGWAARHFDQCSSFGSVLDMVTDRCGTTGFLYVLGNTATRTEDASLWLRLVCLGLLLLDISSHWVQMHSSLALGVHHKSADGNREKNILVQWFYRYYWFFGYLCVGAECTYVLLYARLQLRRGGSPMVAVQQLVDVVLALCIPGCCAKQVVNVAQLASSCYAIAAHDAAERNSLSLIHI